MATGGGSTAPEKKEAYYLRLHLLIVKEGTAILKAKFDHYVPPSQLYTTLQNHFQTIYKAKNQNSVVRGQYHLLFPQYSPPTSDDFDISLLVYLLSNFCGLNRRSKWWGEKDNNKIPDSVVDEEADITRIKNMRNEMQHKNVASLEEVDFKSMWELLEKVLLRLAATCNITAQDQQQKIDEVKTRTLDIVSEEMRSLRANTELFLQDYQDSTQYAETAAYKKAKDILEEKQVVILTGHPGEGKTTMAARLALNMSDARNCLKLSGPSDWRKIDLSLKLFDTIIIDDIFGSGALDQRLVGDWKQFLPEIDIAVKKKAVRVIITSRHYIFEESKDELGSLQMLKEENKSNLLITSSELSDEERLSILKIQANKNEKEIPINIIIECIEASKGPSEDNEDFLFGFPECASMFVRNDEMRSTGAAFFKKPATFFKRYLEDLYRGKNKDKFIALVALWAKEDKKLSKDELRKVTKVSDHIKRVVEVFDLDLNKDFLEMMRLSLESHAGGYLVYNEKTDDYTFSHNVIADMVGLVIGRAMPEETVEICPRDFLMEYVSVNETNENDFKVVLKDRKIHCLVEKCTEMLLRRNCNKIAESPDVDEFQMLQRSGKRSNDIKIVNKIDFGIIKHKAFTSAKFVREFVNHVVKKNLVKEVFSVPVISMKGYFLDYGISMKKLVMCLMGYAWYSGATVFAKEVITRDITEMENVDRTVSLLLATHSGQKESVEYLLEHDAKITGDVIYIAAHKKSVELLKMLLQSPNTNVNDRGNAINGNYPLIVAARKGLTQAVECMLEFKADPTVQNTAKMTALHKAILYKHTQIISALTEAGAPINIKGGKFKRTPLHLAVDLGKVKYVKMLLQKGTKVEDVLKTKDYRGQFPIHIAAIRGNVKIVRLLFNVDRTQETLRISSYGTKSLIKGMSIFHVAIWKKNEELLTALIDMDINPNIQDFFGQTPLFFAIMKDQDKLVRKLLRYPKTDKRKPQKQGFTPLHAAIHRKSTKIAIKLVEHSDVNASDRYGRTALHVACEKPNLHVIKELLRNGADPRKVIKRGDTVYHILRRKRRKTSSAIIQESKVVEKLLADFDPEFLLQLPNLKNKSGNVIKVSYRPSGTISREQLLIPSPGETKGDSDDNSGDGSRGTKRDNSKHIHAGSDSMDNEDNDDSNDDDDDDSDDDDEFADDGSYDIYNEDYDDSDDDSDNFNTDYDNMDFEMSYSVEGETEDEDDFF